MSDKPDGEETQTETNDWTVDSALTEIKKLREEAKANRVKRQEADTALETMKAETTELTSKVKTYEEQLSKFVDYDEIKTTLESVKQENKRMGFKVELAGKVIDTDKALKLIDDDDVVEGRLDVAKFLEKNPFLAAKGNITNPASNKGTVSTGNTMEDVSKMSEQDMVKFFDSYSVNKK